MRFDIFQEIFQLVALGLSIYIVSISRNNDKLFCLEESNMYYISLLLILFWFLSLYKTIINNPSNIIIFLLCTISQIYLIARIIHNNYSKNIKCEQLKYISYVTIISSSFSIMYMYYYYNNFDLKLIKYLSNKFCKN